MRIFIVISPFFIWSVVVSYNTNETLSSSKKVLSICSIVESGNPGFYLDYSRIAAALDIAVQQSNNLILANTNYTIVRHHKNSSPYCTAKTPVIGRFLEWQDEGIKCDVYIGPGCSEGLLDMYKVAEFQKKIVIACPGAGLSAKSGLPRSVFPYLLRTSYTAVALGRSIVSFLDLYKYTHITMLVHRDDVFYTELGDQMREYIRGSRLDIFNKANIQFLSGEQKPNSTALEISDEYLASLLRDANLVSRVIVIFANGNITRRTLVQANGLGMADGQHVYVGVELFPSETWGTFAWERGDRLDQVAWKAYRSFILITLAKEYQEYGYQDDFAESVKRLALTKYGYQYSARTEIDPIAMGYYYAVVLYAQGVRAMLNINRSVYDTAATLRFLKNSTVKSPINTEILMASTGDKVVFYDVQAFDIVDGRHKPFLRLDIVANSFLSLVPIKWPSEDGMFPPDVPRCGYTGLDCKGETNVTLVAVVSVFLLALIICGAAVALYYIRARRTNLDPFWWRYRMADLEFVGKHTTSSRLTASIFDTKTMTRTSVFTTVCSWKAGTLGGAAVAVKRISMDQPGRPTSDLIVQMNEVHHLRHTNLQRFIGLCLDEKNCMICVVGESCQKGCLDDLLRQKSLPLDWSFKHSLMYDITKAMHYLHNSSVKSHGFLTSTACLVDSRLSVKLTDYGVTRFRRPVDLMPLGPHHEDREYNILLYRAPELLRSPMPPRGTQKGDVYSFAIILQQIVLRSGPFESAEDSLMFSTSIHQLLLDITSEQSGSFVRPTIPKNCCTPSLLALTEACWAEAPSIRPPFSKINDAMRKMSGVSGGNLVDVLLKRMEIYAFDLEKQVEIKTQQFMDEKMPCENLLSQMLPKAVAASLVRGDPVPPEFFPMVTVYFSDVVGFTTIAAASTPMNVISMLNDLYTSFDHVLERHDAYKVETIGDAYMVASGLPVQNGDLHAREVAHVALKFLETVKAVPINDRPGEHLRIRSGMHSGSCVAGIIGIKAPRYCLFGDSINTSSRMESTGEPMKIQTTQATRDLLKLFDQFQVVERGQVAVKGKGEMTTYWVLPVS